MPRVSKLSLPPIDWGKEAIAQRVARIMKKRGYTQVQLAGKLVLLKTGILFWGCRVEICAPEESKQLRNNHGQTTSAPIAR
jgi:hypothetical protein